MDESLRICDPAVDPFYYLYRIVLIGCLIGGYWLFLKSNIYSDNNVTKVLCAPRRFGMLEYIAICSTIAITSILGVLMCQI